MVKHPQRCLRNWIYYGIGLGIGLGIFKACELKFPTMPGLPARWNTKLVLPFLDRRYSFDELVYRADEPSNPIFADTSGNLYFTAGDSTLTPVTVDPLGWRQVPGASTSKNLELRRTLKWRADSTVVPLRYTLKIPLSQANNKIIRGQLSGSPPPGYNRLMLKAVLSDSFTNIIKVKITSLQLKNRLTGAALADSLVCGTTLRADSIQIDLATDSVSNGGATFLDSLSFTLDVIVDGKLPISPNRLNQNLALELRLLPLEFSALRGVVIAQGYIPGLALLNPPAGAAEIQFDSAVAVVDLNADATVFEQASCQFIGKKAGGLASSQDSLLTLPVTAARLAIPNALRNLPDSLQFYLRVYSKVDDYHSGNLPATGVSAKYTVYLPLRFTLPTSITLAAGKSSRYCIKDSTTQANIIDRQNGVLFDCEVENCSPLTGTITLLVSNFDLFPTDTSGGQLPADFILQGDQVFHVDTDTVLVQIDTLLIIELPEAEAVDGRIIVPGKSRQSFLAAAAVVAFFRDTCYLKPHFRLVNTQGSPAVLNADQYIRIRSYLNILLASDAIKQ